MVEITDVASGKIKEVLSQNPGKHVRVIVRGYGWGGPKLGLVLDEPQGNETAIPINGIDVLISDEVKAFVEGNTIDYVKEPYREGFTIGAGGCSEGCSGC